MTRHIKNVLLYIILTYTICYAMVAVFLSVEGDSNGMDLIILAPFYMVVPMIVAIFMQKYILKQPLVKPLGISFKFNTWFFVAWFLPPVIAFAAFGVSLLLPGVRFTPDMSGFLPTVMRALTPEQAKQATELIAGLRVHFIWFALLNALIAGTTINALLAFGEELGWRGFLLNELSALGFWKSSALTGIIWGFWHAPLILMGLNYPQHPELGIAVMVGWTLLLAPILSYIRLKSHSVIAASIFHGTLNSVPVLALLLITGGDDLTVGITGLAGFIALAAVNLVIFIYDRFFTTETANQILKTMENAG